MSLSHSLLWPKAKTGFPPRNSRKWRCHMPAFLISWVFLYPMEVFTTPLSFQRLMLFVMSNAWFQVHCSLQLDGSGRDVVGTLFICAFCCGTVISTCRWWEFVDQIRLASLQSPFRTHLVIAVYEGKNVTCIFKQANALLRVAAPECKTPCHKSHSRWLCVLG